MVKNIESKGSIPEGTATVSTILQHWVPPVLTAVLGIVAGIALSTYNSDISDNRYFLEKRAVAADKIANEFSRYVVNWGRLVQLRKLFDRRESDPSEEEKENFKRVVFNRNDYRDKLFSSFDSAHLYYDDEASNLISNFREWDIKQSTLTIDQLPDIKEWRAWQKRILRQLHGDISQ